MLFPTQPLRAIAGLAAGVFTLTLPALESTAADVVPEMRFSEAPDPTRAEAAPQTFRWEKVEGESLALIGPYGVVWKLNHSPQLAKPHFHPLKTADGRPLTWVEPPDHVWHYGLWHAWKFINGVNYWEENAKTRRADGTTRVGATEVLRTDESGAAVRLRLAYHPDGKPDAVVMNDVIDLTLSMPDENGSYSIHWRQETTAVRDAVVLDRTPLPKEPNGKPWGGYGGLSLRASRYLREATLLNSAGEKDLATHRRPADWMMLAGQLDGRAAAITIFDHPANPRHPTPWFVELRPSEPFWYFNPAFLHDSSFTLKPGEPLVRRYLVRVDNGQPAAAALAADYRRFSEEKE